MVLVRGCCVWDVTGWIDSGSEVSVGILEEIDAIIEIKTPKDNLKRRAWVVALVSGIY